VKRHRLDKALVNRGLVASRDRAQRLIMAGGVRVNGQLADKAGAPVDASDAIELTQDDIPFVSRGGLKLEAALAHFEVLVNDRVVLDVGASTGGFTDCVLRRGARAVVAIDVGYGQFAWSLRQDPRVVLIERQNIRFLDSHALPQQPDLVVIDVSFISLAMVLPKVVELAPSAEVLALVKPQFEVGKGQVGKGGVVRDPELRAAAVASVRACAAGLGFECVGAIESPVPGPKGNRETFLYLRPPPQGS
jgi:23S rRNA (cytidine1920-2'-O)/16S rRNA (cytidine1409-2'-O)-methyltransferase